MQSPHSQNYRPKRTFYFLIHVSSKNFQNNVAKKHEIKVGFSMRTVCICFRFSRHFNFEAIHIQCLITNKNNNQSASCFDCTLQAAAFTEFSSN